MPALPSSQPEQQAHDRMLRNSLLWQVSAKRACPDCVGSGCRPGSRPVFCALCKGTGNVRAHHAGLTGERHPIWLPSRPWHGETLV